MRHSSAVSFAILLKHRKVSRSESTRSSSEWTQRSYSTNGGKDCRRKKKTKICPSRMVCWDRCEFVFFPQPQSLHVCLEINCEEAGHGCKCLDVAESPAVRQAAAGERYLEKSWGYDGLQPLPPLAQVSESLTRIRDQMTAAATHKGVCSKVKHKHCTVGLLSFSLFFFFTKLNLPA